MKQSLCSIYFVFVTTIVLSSATIANPDDSNLPIRKVVLYSSGVGYFEHFGKITGTVETNLLFKTE